MRNGKKVIPDKREWTHSQNVGMLLMLEPKRSESSERWDAVLTTRFSRFLSSLHCKVWDLRVKE